MRKIALLLILIPSCLSAAVFDSNSIGQILSFKDELEGVGYEGETENGETTIYHDGEIVITRVDTESGYTITFPDYSETTVLENGRRVRTTIETAEGETVYTYIYDGERLSSVSVSSEEGIERRVVYLDTPAGRLAGLSGDADSRILPLYYIYEAENGMITSTASSDDAPAPPVGYEVGEDGSWREEGFSNGRPVIRTYSPEGLLISTEGSGVREEYRYDDEGRMTFSFERRGSTTLVTEYSDGKPYITERYNGAMLESVRRHLNTGDVEELRYSDGVLRARILFDRDGYRVKSVENYR